MNLNEYHLAELLELMIGESATQLDLASGSVQVVWIQGMDFLVQGPPIPPREIEQLPVSMNETGSLQNPTNSDLKSFLFRFSESAQFVIELRRESEGDQIHLSIRPANV